MQALTPRARYTLALLTTIYALGYADRGVINLLLDDIKAEFQLTDTVLGLITGFGFTLTQVVLGIPIARLADRTRRVDILTAGLFLWSAATALCGRVSSAWQLAFARMTVGLGEACLVAPSHSLLTDLVPRERRTQAFGVLASGGDIGLILALLIGGWVQHYWGWRTAFVVAGLPGILVAVVFRSTVKEPVRPLSRGVGVERLAETLRFLGGQRAYVYAVLGGTAIGLTLFPLQIWAPAMLRRVHHLSDREVGTYMALARGLAIAGVILGAMVTGVLERRGSEWRLRTPALACVLVAPLVLVFVLAGTPLVALVALTLFTFAIGAHQAAVFSTCQTVAMPDMRALAAAIFMFSTAVVGSGVGSLLVGAASDALTPQFGDQSLRYALLMCVATSLCAALLFWNGARYVQMNMERAEGWSSRSLDPVRALT